MDWFASNWDTILSIVNMIGLLFIQKTKAAK